jgi:Dit-like phage tail protein
MILSYLAGGALVSIEVDATIREEHYGETVVTEYHVERGANVADHARPGNDRITCDVVVTDTPIRVPTTNTDGVRGGFSQVELEVPALTHFPRLLPGVGVVTSLLPKHTEKYSVEVLNFDGTMNRRQSIYNELTLLRTSTTLVNISTPLREYTDMVIRTVSAPRGPADGSSITFTFVATAITFVDSEIVAVKADAVKKKSAGVKPGKSADPRDKQSVLDAAGTKMGALTKGNPATELLR